MNTHIQIWLKIIIQIFHALLKIHKKCQLFMHKELSEQLLNPGNLLSAIGP